MLLRDYPLHVCSPILTKVSQNSLLCDGMMMSCLPVSSLCFRNCVPLTSWPACALKESALADRARESRKGAQSQPPPPGEVPKTQAGNRAWSGRPHFWPGKQTRATVLCCISGQRQQPALSLPRWRLTRGPTSHLPHLSHGTRPTSVSAPWEQTAEE